MYNKLNKIWISSLSLTLALLLAQVTAPLSAAATQSSCKIYLEQNISDEGLTDREIQALYDTSIQTLKNTDGFNISTSDHADYWIVITTLHNMDPHNARLLNIIAHTEVYTAKDRRLFMYTQDFGKWNHFGNKRKAFSYKNHERAIQNALKNIKSCDQLNQLDLESRTQHPSL